MRFAEVPIRDPFLVPHTEPLKVIGRPQTVDKETRVAPAVRALQKSPVGWRQRAPEPRLGVGDLFVGRARISEPARGFDLGWQLRRDLLRGDQLPAPLTKKSSPVEFGHARSVSLR